MAWLAALAGVGTKIGGMVAQNNSWDKANADRSAAIEAYIKATIPDIAEQQLALQQFQSSGTLTPRLQQAIAQNPSEFQKVTGSQTGVDAQVNALRSLEDLGSNGGLSLGDKGNLNDILSQSATQARGADQAVDQQMAQRGVSNSGLALASKLQENQAAADRASKNALGVASQAQSRALQAIQGAGSLGGQMNQQAFSQNAQKAQAADTINRFNTQNLRDVNAGNANAGTQADMYNLNRSQDLLNKNTDLENKEQQYNKGLYQKQFDNQMEQANGLNKAYDTRAAGYSDQGNKTQDEFDKMGSGIAGLGGLF